MLKRKRLSHEESRNVALAAASEVLLSEGPQAVTLKAVAARIGRTHANLLHHFGSVADLQRALADYLAEQVCADMSAATGAESAPGAIVDLVFDAFDRDGDGALGKWMLVTNNLDALDPAVECVLEMLIARMPGDLAESERERARELTLSLVLLALGDSLVGSGTAGALGLARNSAREQAVELLVRELPCRESANA